MKRAKIFVVFIGLFWAQAILAQRLIIEPEQGSSTIVVNNRILVSEHGQGAAIRIRAEGLASGGTVSLSATADDSSEIELLLLSNAISAARPGITLLVSSFDDTELDGDRVVGISVSVEPTGTSDPNFDGISERIEVISIDDELPDQISLSELLQNLGELGKASSSVSRIETFGCQAVPILIDAIDDFRDFPDSRIQLPNDGPIAFEAFRTYGPEKVVDAIAALLNQATKLNGPFIYNGGDFGTTDVERLEAIAFWRQAAANRNLLACNSSIYQVPALSTAALALLTILFAIIGASFSAVSATVRSD